MRLSVWNYKTRTYDYYDAPDDGGTHVGAPPSPMLSNRLGATPDQAAWKLPAGARKIGSGPVAQGKVASLGDDGGGGFTLSDAIGGAILVGLAYKLIKG